jgi:hypothetical protein
MHHRKVAQADRHHRIAPTTLKKKLKHLPTVYKYVTLNNYQHLESLLLQYLLTQLTRYIFCFLLLLIAFFNQIIIFFFNFFQLFQAQLVFYFKHIIFFKGFSFCLQLVWFNCIRIVNGKMYFIGVHFCLIPIVHCNRKENQ